MNTKSIGSDSNVEGAVVISKSLIGQANDLAIEHETFNTNYIIGGRQALYSLLAKILDLVIRFDSALDKADLIEIVRMQLQNQYGIKTQSNTSNTTLLVRYITRADRKTAHVYARAIEVARANQIEPSEFAKYLEKSGGVERIRSESVTKALTEGGAEDLSGIKAAKLELSRRYLIARSELPLASFRVGQKYQGNLKNQGFKCFICYERDGRNYVLSEHDLDPAQEKIFVEQISEKYFSNLESSVKDVDRFFEKAMIKRKQRAFRLISKKRPELATRIRGSSASE